MPDLPSPVAARLARVRWLDARLLVGVLLVLVPVVVGARLVAAADDTTPVWALTRDLGPGSELGEGDLVRRDVHLAEGLDRYIAAAPPLGYVLVRAVGEGELLPRDSVREAATSELRRLAVEVDAVTVSALDAGAVVDVYVVPEPAAGDEQPPATEQVLAGVTVDDTATDESGLGSATSRTAGVILLVDPQDAQRVLDAQARGQLRLLQVRAFDGSDADP